MAGRIDKTPEEGCEGRGESGRELQDLPYKIFRSRRFSGLFRANSCREAPMSNYRKIRMLVLGGHSCPPPLTLTLGTQNFHDISNV
jgi:hypothetical protein